MRILVNDHAGHAFPVQLSRALARAGHVVLHTYLANNPTTPKGPIAPQPDDPRDLSIEGVFPQREFRKFSPWARRRADLEYGALLSHRVREFRPEIVLSANMPLDAQRLLLKAARATGAAFVFWAQDLLSQAIEFGFRKQGLPGARLAGAIYRGLEKRLLRASDAVVSIAPEFIETLADWGLQPERTFVIENWAPLNEIGPIAGETAWAREQGLAGKFRFLYSGQLGIKHNPRLLLELARHYEGRDDVRVVAVAEGGGADWLRAHADGVRSLKMLPFQPYARLSEVLASGDVLVGILDNDCGAFAVPSKTLSYLCAGKPLLLAAPRQNLAAKIVRRAGAGEVVGGDDVKAFLAAACQLQESKELRQRCGTNARSYAERTFQIDEIVRRFSIVMELARVHRQLGRAHGRLDWRRTGET